MAIPATIGVGGHAHDAEITDMQKAVQALLGAFVSSVLTVAAGGTGSGTGALAQEAWTAPTLLNSWANVGGGAQVAGYMKDSMGFVHLRGQITHATATTDLLSMFTLPSGYQPSATTRVLAIFGGSPAAFGFIDITTSGGVLLRLAQPAGIQVSLDCISFDTR